MALPPQQLVAAAVVFQPPDLVSAVQVTHRDVKPENIILQGIKPGGKVVLVDFGGIQQGDKDIADTEVMDTGTLVGTYGYMAPEQLRGSARPASDLFALGATLLYLLSGTLEFFTSAMMSNSPVLIVSTPILYRYSLHSWLCTHGIKYCSVAVVSSWHDMYDTLGVLNLQLTRTCARRH